MSISKKSKINLFILVINILFICSVFADSYYTVKKGDKIGQLFFFKFLTVDDEVPPTEVRKGGFGSTVKN